MSLAKDAGRRFARRAPRSGSGVPGSSDPTRHGGDPAGTGGPRGGGGPAGGGGGSPHGGDDRSGGRGPRGGGDGPGDPGAAGGTGPIPALPPVGASGPFGRGTDGAWPTHPGRTLLVLAAWITTAGLALIAAGRLVHLDDAVAWPASAANALTPLLYLPVYAALAIGFALRRSRLMILCVLVAAAHLVWTAPEVIPGNPDEAGQGSARLRVMTANLLYRNAEAGRLGQQIRQASPDVIVLVEVSPLTLAKVRESGALAGYRYSEARPEEGAFGAAVFSRFPLSDAAAPEVAGSMSLRATVRVDERRSFVVYAVHTISPTSGDYARRWRAQLDQLQEEVRAARLPVVLAGDFNATRDHRPMRRLISAGVRDAHDVVGAGWTPTWNADMVMFPPVLRIDHVLASPAFAITSYQVGTEFGSDHKPVTVDLALR
ncbi:endonuclease/exonuclease/phosphatase family protein [Parafrankia sp. FMc2]|uniref:endonuclease/exonuclease/phosphatase family protein n=1 Tax=Parafrankia sp. FMc2 TaxID=3233196 RepID=UPI0034D4B0E8